MKYIVLLFLISTLLNAQYIRSIRLGSFLTESKAQRTLKEAQKFLYSYDEMRKYQQEYNFRLKVQKSKQYYLVVLEPVTDREVLQKLLDILRLKYKSAYPKKLKSLPLPSVEKNITNEKKQSLLKKKIVTKEQRKPVSEKKIITLKKLPEKNITKAVMQKPIVKKTERTAVKKNEHPFIIAMMIAILVLILIVIALGIWLLRVLRKKRELQNNNEMLSSELFDVKKRLETKEKILSHVSHELRNPIASIMGLSELILENELPAFERENVEHIEESAEKALEIVNDILNISKINSGELQIETREFNLNTMIEHVLSSTYLQAQHNNVEVLLEIDDAVPANIIGDSLRLGQILINLLSNAIKFSEHGTVTLKVNKKETRAQSVVLEFSVVDDGIGMTQEELERVFDSYIQAESSTSREFGGTGLGLAISKELVEKMGGAIRAHSQKDVGSTFIFTIEAGVFDSENKRNYRLPSKECLNKNVLIVESLQKNVIALLRAFRYFKYKTYVVASLDESILREEVEYDIIVINQTQLNESTVKRLQKMHFNNRTKTRIIVTTYRFTKVDKKIMEDLDVAGVLKIPFTQQNVLDILTDIYGVKKSKEVHGVSATQKKIQELHSKNILIAEDNKLNHRVLEGLLEKIGATVSFVNNGAELLKLIKKGYRYDLILMDIEMPVVNGYEATIEIRKDRNNDHTAIIALSAKTDDASIEKAFSVGMQGYLKKPLSIDEFYKTIYEALSHRKTIHRDKSIENIKPNDGELTVLKGLGKFEDADEFYKSLLNDFLKMYADASESFKQLIREQKYKEGIVLARDIKEVSLNIGAYGVCESAAALEYEFAHKSKEKILNSFEEFETHFLRLLREIELYLDEK